MYIEQPVWKMTRKDLSGGPPLNPVVLASEGWVEALLMVSTERRTALLKVSTERRMVSSPLLL